MTQFDIRVMTVDSFTRCRFGGNPAAVIPDAEDIPKMYYPQIANEINLAQTAFISELSNDFCNLEFFSPSKMMNFSGHATIAAFFILGQMGYIRPIENGPKPVKAKLKDGSIIDVLINYKNYESNIISIKVPKATEIREHENILNPENMRKILRIQASDIKDVMIAHAYQNDIYVFVKDLEVLRDIKPDLWAIRTITEKTNTIGISFIYVGEGEKPYAYCRYTAPVYGVYEESATGSAAACIGSLILDKIQKDKITIYQGQTMGRPSRIVIENINGNYYLSGECRLVMDSVMKI